MQNSIYDIEEKQLPPILVGGIRTIGRYNECGKVFGKLGRKLGRHMNGKPMILCYDGEYKEEGADFEPCFPIKRRVDADSIAVRELPGGRSITLLHRGPYDTLSRSYSRLLEYGKEHGVTFQAPSREVYLKGPGMIFKGNPEKYLTEIQFLVEE